MPVGFFGFALVIAVLIHVLVVKDTGEVVATGFQLLNSGGVGRVIRVEDGYEFTVTEFLGIRHFIPPKFLTHDTGVYYVLNPVGCQ